MTPAPWQGTRPPDRIRHSWRCTRRGAVVETTREDPITGQLRLVAWCKECDQDDLAERIRADAERSGAT